MERGTGTAANGESSSRWIVVFGSSGRVGTSIVSEARAKGLSVIGISRREKGLADYHVHADMNSFEEVVRLTEDVFNRFQPESVIFAHRSRREVEGDSFSGAIRGIEDSLLPVFAMRRVIERSTQTRGVSVVTVGSTAGYSYSSDTEFTYHVDKAAITAAALMLSYVTSSLQVYSNVVVFGEAKDARIETDSEYHEVLYTTIGETLNRPVPTIQSVSRLCVLLATNAVQLQISGQELKVDSGLSKLNVESLFRKAARDAK